MLSLVFWRELFSFPFLLSSFFLFFSIFSFPSFSFHYLKKEKRRKLLTQRGKSCSLPSFSFLLLKEEVYIFTLLPSFSFPLKEEEKRKRIRKNFLSPELPKLPKRLPKFFLLPFRLIFLSKKEKGRSKKILPKLTKLLPKLTKLPSPCPSFSSFLFPFLISLSFFLLKRRREECLPFLFSFLFFSF